MLRYDIRHPVLSDVGSIVRRAVCLATTVLIDPAGRVVADTLESSRPTRWRLSLRDADERSPGKLSNAGRVVAGEEKEPARPLSFPGKVLADAASRRLLIADTAHRIVIANLDGTRDRVAGSGAPSLRDGDFATSCFHSRGGWP